MGIIKLIWYNFCEFIKLYYVNGFLREICLSPELFWKNKLENNLTEIQLLKALNILIQQKWGFYDVNEGFSHF